MLSDANQRLFEAILLRSRVRKFVVRGSNGDLGEVHSLTEEWLPVSSAPSDADLEVCIVDFDAFCTHWSSRATKIKPAGSML